jgi:hypothetical protein
MKVDFIVSVRLEQGLGKKNYRHHSWIALAG